MKQKKKVLIIEDEGDLVEVLLLRLEKEDFLVDAALDGESGLKKALQFAPDVILLDIIMPGLDGFEVCRRLRKAEKTKKIPIIVITAVQNPALEKQVKDCGANQLIFKPLDETKLIALLKNISSA